MGLFSKKTYVCEKCGKEFQKRINLNGKLCDDCCSEEYKAQKELKKQISGYCKYASDELFKQYTSEEMQAIVEHRNALLQKFKFDAGISIAELTEASNNYRKLTDEQAADILTRVAGSTVSGTLGSVYSDSFFVPTHYDGMIVDAEDVFAVGYTTDYRLEGGKSEVILCACFTNDPYVPVFPMIYLGKKGFFEISKSRRGRESVEENFTYLCPNLTYPVQDLKKLKKQIKSDGTVKGSIEQKKMLDFIASAASGIGIFNSKKMSSHLLYESAAMLDSIGYIQEDQINQILKMDKLLNRTYWNKQIKKLANYEIE